MTNSVEDGLSRVGSADWWLWNEDVADTFKDATVAVKLDRSGEDSVGNEDVGSNVAVTLWLCDKESVANVESEPAIFATKKQTL